MKNSISLAITVICVLVFSLGILYVKDVKNQIDKDRIQYQQQDIRPANIDNIETHVRVWPFVDIRTIDPYKKGFRDGYYDYLFDTKYSRDINYKIGYKDGCNYRIK